MAETEALIARKGTDLTRWQDEANLASQWDGRAVIAGELVGSQARRVLDVGAGAMTLRACLPPGCAYVPADVAKRSEECLVVDLNRQEFPAGDFDVVTFLGVLEYIHDPSWPLRQAALAAPRLVVSYCADTSGDRGYRRGLGWVNDFTLPQFEALLAASGWRIETRRAYKQSAKNAQFVWQCARASGGLDDLPQKDFVVISPVLVDPRTTKRVNVGDGFIMDSALKLIGARPTKVLSSRMPLSADDIELINASRMVLVAGANTLKTTYEIAPGFTPELLSRLSAPVALMGIGHYGHEQATARPLDAPSEALMRGILERFPLVSVRCDASAAYLRGSIPDLADKVLMTSCPVAHTVDGVDRGFLRKPEYDQLVCTVTDRAALESQLWLLRDAPARFPSRRRILALHQDYGNEELWNLAASLGFEIFRSSRHEDFLTLYRDTDAHIGNRLHAHLKCLSHGAVSFLTPFDLRQYFFAQSLDFPLVQSAQDPALQTYDFRRARARIAATQPQMDTFVAAVRSVIGA